MESFQTRGFADMEIAGAANPRWRYVAPDVTKSGETPGDRQAVHITLAVLFLTGAIVCLAGVIFVLRLSQLEIDGNEMRAMYKHRSWNFLGNFEKRTTKLGKAFIKLESFCFFFSLMTVLAVLCLGKD
ncbi:hypothetical protein CEXT_654011 [Caerostris extrusa]|uniref:Uncharacterized protein n=1 Tax=Caerostris extrusa TaxID=172846 RepID=A0AAV4SKY6_CAEEX|nr:hypothetical protein CEXT_654011 [Caerostris extrusa]